MVYPYTHSYSWKSPNDFWFRFTHPNHPQHGLNITGNFNYLIAQARTSIVLGQAIQLGTKDKVIFERGKEVLFEVYDATNYLLDRLHKEIVIYSFYSALLSLTNYCDSRFHIDGFNYQYNQPLEGNGYFRVFVKRRQNTVRWEQEGF